MLLEFLPLEEPVSVTRLRFEATLHLRAFAAARPENNRGSPDENGLPLDQYDDPVESITRNLEQLGTDGDSEITGTGQVGRGTDTTLSEVVASANISSEQHRNSTKGER